MYVVVPTIGRVVYLYDRNSCTPDKPLTGFVADVNVGGNPLTINCAVMSNNGDFILGGLQAVPHKTYQGSSWVFWDWMPYQKGQAAKTEELEAKLGTTGG